MNVASYIAQFLVQKKVRHVFGFQGGAILKLLDEMIATNKISYVQSYHEQASALAADAYSRVTGNIGVAIGTSGPGATNLITGIANAQLDSIPTLFITGQDYTANATANNGVRQNGFQDLDIVRLVLPITKYAVMITDPSRIRYEVERAFWCATSGRPGAVLLDIPIDIQFKEINPTELEGFTPEFLPPYHKDTGPVIAQLMKARRPVILIGGGVRVGHAEKEVRAFATRTLIPVISTVNGLDVVEGTHGFAGLHGHTHANLAVQNADLLLVFGARFGQRQVGKVPEQYTSATVIHIDIDENELQRVFPDEIAIHSDLRTYLTKLNKDLSDVCLPCFNEWQQKIHDWDRKYRANAYLTKEGLEPVKAVECLLKLCTPDTIFTSDVGQNQMWVAQGFRMQEGRRLLNSCGHGTMGFSLPASIGAKTAFPDRQVVCFTGDGGLQMNLQELIFVSHHRVGIKCVVFNNNTLGMMREVQARYYQGHYYGSNDKEFICANLSKLADTFGLGYHRVERLEDITTLRDVFSDDKPYIIELAIALNSRLSNRYDEAVFFERERILHES